QRMLAARARGWAFQDAFRDVTGGLQVRERFDLDPGERLGGVTVAPPDARNVTPAPNAQSAEPAKPARVTFSAPLVVDAEVVPETTAATGETNATPSETDATASETQGAEPESFDEVSAQAGLRAECHKRTGGDTAAAGDLFREILEGVGGLETEKQYDDAMAAVRQHPVFGDDTPPVLTSPPPAATKG